MQDICKSVSRVGNHYTNDSKINYDIMVEKILLREMMLMIKVIIIMIKMSNKCHSHVIHVVWLKDRLWCIIQMILLRVIMTWSCSEWYNDSNHVHCNCDTWWKWVISKCHMVTSCKSVGSLTSQGTLQPVKQVIKPADAACLHKSTFSAAIGAWFVGTILREVSIYTRFTSKQLLATLGTDGAVHWCHATDFAL